MWSLMCLLSWFYRFLRLFSEVFIKEKCCTSFLKDWWKLIQIHQQAFSLRGVQGAKFFIPPQFRTPVWTHLHTANQRPRVLICIQPIHRGWFNPRYILVRTTLLLSNARGVVVKATCIALHCPACSRGVSSNPLAGFFFFYNKMGNNGVYSVRGDTQMMK